MKKLRISEEQKTAAKELANKVLDDIKPGEELIAFNGKLNRKTYIGFLGEIIYADYFGLPRPKFLPGSKDPGYDFIHDDIKVDVKTVEWAKYGYPNLILYPRDLEKDAEAYFLITVQRFTANLLGGISKEVFKTLAQKKDFGYGERYYVSSRQLVNEMGVY